MAEKKDKKWIQKAVKNPGSFTAKAKKRGISSAQLQRNVEENPNKYDEKIRKQPTLREALVRLNKKEKSS